MLLSKPYETADRSVFNLGSVLTFAFFTAFFAAPAAAQTPSSVTGIWCDSAGEGAIEMAPCGNRMCGRIVWLKNPLNAEGRPLFDRHNPDTAQQSRLICGLQVLRDLQPLTDGSWGRGIVYDPKKGAENEASIKPLGGGKLMLTGYGLFGLSKSFEWTRAPDDLPRCGAKPIQADAAPGPAAVPAAKNTATPAIKPAAATAAKAAAPATAKPATLNAGATGNAPAPASKPAAPAAKPAEALKTTPPPKPSSSAPVSKPDVKAADTGKTPPAVTQVKPASPSVKQAATSKVTAPLTKPVTQAAKAVVKKPAVAASLQKGVTAPTVKVISTAPASAIKAAPAVKPKAVTATVATGGKPVNTKPAAAQSPEAAKSSPGATGAPPVEEAETAPVGSGQ